SKVSCQHNDGILIEKRSGARAARRASGPHEGSDPLQRIVGGGDRTGLQWGTIASRRKNGTQTRGCQPTPLALSLAFSATPDFRLRRAQSATAFLRAAGGRS